MHYCLLFQSTLLFCCQLKFYLSFKLMFQFSYNAVLYVFSLFDIFIYSQHSSMFNMFTFILPNKVLRWNLVRKPSVQQTAKYYINCSKQKWKQFTKNCEFLNPKGKRFTIVTLASTFQYDKSLKYAQKVLNRCKIRNIPPKSTKKICTLILISNILKLETFRFQNCVYVTITKSNIIDI